MPSVDARRSWSSVLQAGLSCSCLWQWKVAESRPSAAAAWQPGSFALGLLVLSDWGSSTALKCRDCGFQVEHLLGSWARMWHLVQLLQPDGVVCL